MLSRFEQDVRFATRGLARTPGFSVVVLLTMALGVGATTAIFSVAHGVLWAPTIYRYGDRMMYTPQRMEGTGAIDWYWSYPNYVDLRDRTRSFEKLEGIRLGSAILTGRDHAVQVFTRYVTPGFLDFYNVSPHLGRMLGPEDNQAAGAHPVVTITHSLWQSYFGADPHVIGAPIVLSGTTYEIVGVLNPEFEYPFGQDLGSVVDVWLPASMAGAIHPRGDAFLEDRSAGAFSVIGALAEGVTPEQAEADLNRIADELESEFPVINRARGAVVFPLLDVKTTGLYSALILLLISAAVLLLIGCFNVTNLMLVRHASRLREVAIRFALGAGRGGVARFLIAEGLVLSIAGGGLGVLAAIAGLPPLLRVVEGMLRVTSVQLPPEANVAVNGPVLLVALAASVVAGLMFALVPALRLAPSRLQSSLSGGVDRHSAGRRGSLLRSGLVVAEIAAATMLLAGSTLMTESIFDIQGTEVGFRTDGVLSFRVNLPQRTYPTDEARLRIVDALANEIDALPGTEWAAPWGPSRPVWGGPVQSLVPAGRVYEDESEAPRAQLHMIAPGALGKLEIELLAGREFTPSDWSPNAQVAIVSASLAAKLWPGGDAVGQLLGPFAPPGEEPAEPWRVVGVAADTRLQGRMPTLEGLPEQNDLFIPLAQGAPREPYFVVGMAGEPDVETIRRAIQRVDPDLPMYEIATLDELMRRREGPTQFAAVLIAGFAVAALLLAALGVYGVLAFTVRRRTLEIGLRSALGADPAATLRYFVGYGARLAVVGTLLGTLGALALQRILASIMAGIVAMNLLIVVLPAALLVCVGIIACYLPARRATRIDPIVALRRP